MSSRRGRPFEGDAVDAVIDKLNRLQNAVADAIELLESIDERLKKLEERFAGGEEGRGGKRSAKRGYRVVVSGEPGGRRRGKTAIEIMEEQGVVFESDLKSIKNKEKFVEYLKKAGVIVLEGSKERVMVTKSYLDNFLNTLKGFRGPGEAEEKIKDEKELRFYRFLRDSGMLTYDSRSGWTLHV